MRALLWPLRVVVLALSAWASAALWIDIAAPQILRVALILLVVTAVGWLVRGGPARVLLAFLPVAMIAGWWLGLAPSQDRAWAADVARLPEIRVEGEIVTVRNLRDFDWNGPETATERWIDVRYDLAAVRTLDLFVSDWGAYGIVHTILSWGFADGRHLAVSFETRKEAHEAYSAVLGFFRQFELIGVAATERDLLSVRAVHRGERVTRWPIVVTPDGARALLEAYLDALRRLQREPAWYNALTVNCTTAITPLVEFAGYDVPLDWRILVNAKLDELLLERGLIAGGAPIASLRERADVTERIRAAVDAPDFSAALRAGAG